MILNITDNIMEVCLHLLDRSCITNFTNLTQTIFKQTILLRIGHKRKIFSHLKDNWLGNYIKIDQGSSFGCATY